MSFPFTISVTHTNPVQLYESTKRVIHLAEIIIPIHENTNLRGVSWDGKE
jgi:hypothetical protein